MATEAETARLQIRDPRVMRALAHPARLAIMEYLSDGLDATATECAEVCGLSPSATSYHLRALARFELVEEAPSRGDARERRWRSRARGGINVEADAVDGPEALAAGRDLMNVYMARQDAQARRWLEGSPGEPKPWRDAVGFMEGRLLLTADELAALSQAVTDLVQPYLRNRRVTDPPPGAREVRLVYRAFPTGA